MMTEAKDNSNTKTVFSVVSAASKLDVPQKKLRIPCRKYQVTDTNIRAKLIKKMLESDITIRQVNKVWNDAIGCR